MWFPDTLHLFIYETALVIHEHCLAISPIKEVSFDPDGEVRRMENLWICLQTIKSWFSTFFSEETSPIEDWPWTPMSTYSQMAHCLVALYRLTTFESPDVPSWDRQRVLRELNFGDLLRDWRDRWERVPRAAGLDIDLRNELDDDENPWSYCKRGLTTILHWWDIKIAPRLVNDTAKESQPVVDHGGNSTETNPSNADFNSLLMEDFSAVDTSFIDDAWMRDMLGGGLDYLKEPSW